MRSPNRKRSLKGRRALRSHERSQVRSDEVTIPETTSREKTGWLRGHMSWHEVTISDMVSIWQMGRLRGSRSGQMRSRDRARSLQRRRADCKSQEWSQWHRWGLLDISIDCSSSVWNSNGAMRDHKCGTKHRRIRPPALMLIAIVLYVQSPRFGVTVLYCRCSLRGVGVTVLYCMCSLRGLVLLCCTVPWEVEIHGD